MVKELFKSLINRFKRPYDFAVGGDENPYLLRWWIIPRNERFNIYLHKFLRDDEDRALHDHPWWSLGIILHGAYKEHLQNGIVKIRVAGWPVLRKPEHQHRIELFNRVICEEHDSGNHYYIDPEKPKHQVWTLFITGPKIREWGFWCEKGFVPWYRFVNTENPGLVGAGCDG